MPDDLAAVTSRYSRAIAELEAWAAERRAALDRERRVALASIVAASDAVLDFERRLAEARARRDEAIEAAHRSQREAAARAMLDWQSEQRRIEQRYRRDDDEAFAKREAAEAKARREYERALARLRGGPVDQAYLDKRRALEETLREKIDAARADYEAAASRLGRQRNRAVEEAFSAYGAKILELEQEEAARVRAAEATFMSAVAAAEAIRDEALAAIPEARAILESHRKGVADLEAEIARRRAEIDARLADDIARIGRTSLPT